MNRGTTETPCHVRGEPRRVRQEFPLSVTPVQKEPSVRGMRSQVQEFKEMHSRTLERRASVIDLCEYVLCELFLGRYEQVSTHPREGVKDRPKYVIPPKSILVSQSADWTSYGAWRRHYLMSMNNNFPIDA